jgi:hypothetical protein
MMGGRALLLEASACREWLLNAWAKEGSDCVDMEAGSNQQRSIIYLL